MAAATSSFPNPEDLEACEFSNWYPIFSKCTIRSTVLELPAEPFRRFMNADRLLLPAGAQTSCALLEHCNTAPSWSDDDDEDEDISESEFDNQSDQDLGDLTASINTAIQKLGGAVLPKLNWSAPKDAIWANAGTMECRFAGDVYLLLKASDFVSSDLDLLETQNRPPNLVLRKWCNLHASQEFRCFVRDRRLIGISQRHDSQYWPHLADPEYQDQVECLVFDFIEIWVERSCFPLSNYAVDVYIDRNNRLWLLDFNVWNTRTDPLLFSWPDLLQREDFAMLVVTDSKQVRADPLASYRAPMDTIDLATNSEKFEQFMSDCIAAKQNETSDAEE